MTYFLRSPTVTARRKVLDCAGLALALFITSANVYGASTIHSYDLNGNFLDSLGGPSLVPQGGTLSATGYSFGPNQGLTLSNALANPANYSIELFFQFQTVSGFRKIIDFKDRVSDNGVYVLNARLNFFPFTTGPTVTIPANTDVHLVVTRDGTTNRFFGYVDGVQQNAFIDPGGEAIFSAANNIIQLFRDDFRTRLGEASAGVVDLIRIYDGPLSAAEVAALFDQVPDFDGVPRANDNCPTVFNPGQEDADVDGVGDACDICPSIFNPDQDSTVGCIDITDRGTCFESQVVTFSELDVGEVSVLELGAVAPQTITFEILNTSCALGDTFEFFLNGVSLGSIAADPAITCTCAAPIQTFAVTDSALIASLWNIGGNNTLRFVKTGTGNAFAWVRARIDAGASSETLCVFDFNGGNCDVTNLCSADFTFGTVDQSTTFADPFGPVLTTVSVTPFTNSQLPETIDISSLADGDYLLCVSGAAALAPVPDSITFDILNTLCSRPGTYEFFLNGVSLGTTAADPTNGCTCSPALQSVVVSDAGLLTSAWNTAALNTLSFTLTGDTLLSWVRALVQTGALSETVCIFDVNGGNCDVLNLCIAQFACCQGGVSGSADIPGFVVGFGELCIPFTKAGHDTIAINTTCPPPGCTGTLIVRTAKHTVGLGSHPGSTKVGLAGILVGVYDKSAGSCARQQDTTPGDGISWQEYAAIVANCTPVATAVTDAGGVATLELSAGDYLVITHFDSDGDGTLDQFLGVSASDFLCDEVKQKRLQLLVDGAGKKKPGKTTRLSGSELLIIEPEYVLWDETEQLYPFVFESVGDWGVTTTVSPPDGFVSDYGSLAEDVVNEIKAVQFTITETGSELVPTQTTFDIIHRGIPITIQSRVDIALTARYAHSRGFNVGELRRRGLILPERGRRR